MRRASESRMRLDQPMQVAGRRDTVRNVAQARLASARSSHPQLEARQPGRFGAVPRGQLRPCLPHRFSPSGRSVGSRDREGAPQALGPGRQTPAVRRARPAACAERRRATPRATGRTGAPRTPAGRRTKRPRRRRGTARAPRPTRSAQPSSGSIAPTLMRPICDHGPGAGRRPRDRRGPTAPAPRDQRVKSARLGARRTASRPRSITSRPRASPDVPHLSLM